MAYPQQSSNSNSTPANSGPSIVSQLPWFQIIMAGGLIVGVVVAGKSIGKKLGLVKDGENIKAIDTLNKIPELLPGYFTTGERAGNRTHQLPEENRKIIADALFAAKGMFKDDHDAIWAQLKKATYKTQLASLAQGFEKYTSKDLATFLSSIFTTEEIARFMTWYNSLPSGIVK